MAHKATVVITPYRDGPLLVRGPIELLDPSGRRLELARSPVALCRCGKSRIRPFCDGTHKLAKFRTGPPQAHSEADSRTRQASSEADSGWRPAG